MNSMIIRTKPDRKILEASSELAEAVGAQPEGMCGQDCAGVLQCRNAQGEPLCGQFCPALAAARSASGLAQQLPLWLEGSDGRLQQFSATFQRIGSLPGGMVVAHFGDADEEVECEAETVPAPAAGDWVPQLERRPRRMYYPGPDQPDRGRRQRGKLRLISG